MEKRRSSRDIGRFSGTTSKLKFSFLSRVLAPSRRDGAMLNTISREGRESSFERPFQFYESFTYFSILLRRHVTHDRRTSSHGLWNSVSDRQPKATRPFCTEHRVSKWFKYASKKRKRKRKRKRNKILIHLTSYCPYTFAPFQIQMILTLMSSKSNLKNSFLSTYRHKYLV